MIKISNLDMRYPKIDDPPKMTKSWWFLRDDRILNLNWRWTSFNYLFKMIEFRNLSSKMTEFWWSIQNETTSLLIILFSCIPSLFALRLVDYENKIKSNKRHLWRCCRCIEWVSNFMWMDILNIKWKWKSNFLCLN